MRLKALPLTKVCINCSNTGTYKALITVNGEGDHTWNDIQVVTSEQHDILNSIKNLENIEDGSCEIIDWDNESNIPTNVLKNKLNDSFAFDSSIDSSPDEWDEEDEEEDEKELF
jgi:hypothetical protein